MGKGGSSSRGRCRSSARRRNRRSVSAAVMLRPRPSNASLRRTSRVLPAAPVSQLRGEVLALHLSCGARLGQGFAAPHLGVFACSLHQGILFHNILTNRSPFQLGLFIQILTTFKDSSSGCCEAPVRQKQNALGTTYILKYEGLGRSKRTCGGGTPERGNDEGRHLRTRDLAGDDIPLAAFQQELCLLVLTGEPRGAQHAVAGPRRPDGILAAVLVVQRACAPLVARGMLSRYLPYTLAPYNPEAVHPGSGPPAC